jgi:hypothetical protein
MLEVEFNRNTLAIWSNITKGEIKNCIPDFDKRAKKYQEEIEKFVFGKPDKPYKFSDNRDFPFRYISGGTLPILKIGGRSYYCLFYREIFPIGWNIANGGADTFHELLHPMDVVRRELGEELLIVNPNPKKRQRYVFEWDTGELVDWPGFSVVRKLFHKEYPDLNLAACEELKTKVEWSEGPDTIWVSCKDEEPHLEMGCFVNINATDFGIEIDRIARISIYKEAVIFDGEVSGNSSVGAPIGLFPVDEFNAKVNEGSTDFYPEIFFYDAKLRKDGTKGLQKTIEDVYIPRLIRKKILTKTEIKKGWEKVNKNNLAYDLCPVTRTLVRRHIGQEKFQRSQEIPKYGPRHFFLSWARPDEKYAREIYTKLHGMGMSVYFSEEAPVAITDFSAAIHDEIRNSMGMIILATRPEHMIREGVIYEWWYFLTLIRDGQKPKTSPIINVSSFGYDKLPTPLSKFHLIHFDQRDVKDSLRRIEDYIARLRVPLADYSVKVPKFGGIQQ